MLEFYYAFKICSKKHFQKLVVFYMYRILKSLFQIYLLNVLLWTKFAIGYRKV
jgi:hypothetical protein